MIQAAAAHPMKHDAAQEKRGNYRIERQFSTQRRPRDLIRDLLRAHSGR